MSHSSGQNFSEQLVRYEKYAWVVVLFDKVRATWSFNYTLICKCSPYRSTLGIELITESMAMPGMLMYFYFCSVWSRVWIISVKIFFKTSFASDYVSMQNWISINWKLIIFIYKIIITCSLTPNKQSTSFIIVVNNNNNKYDFWIFFY